MEGQLSVPDIPYKLAENNLELSPQSDHLMLVIIGAICAGFESNPDVSLDREFN